METKAVIFDLDFTLADSTAAVIECARAGFAHAGLPCPADEEIVRNIGMSFQEFAAIHAGDLAEKVIHGFHAVSHRLEWVNTTFLLPGAREILAEIKSRGFLIGLATQKNWRSLVQIAADLVEMVFADQRAQPVCRVQRIAHSPLAGVIGDALQQLGFDRTMHDHPALARFRRHWLRAPRVRALMAWIAGKWSYGGSG